MHFPAHKHSSRGSVLAFVIVVVAVGAVVLIGLLRAAATQSLVNADRQAVLDVGRIMQGITQSVMSDAFNKVGASSAYTPTMAYRDSAWKMSNWTVLQTPPITFLSDPSTLELGNARDPGLPGSLVWDVSLSKAYPITGTVTLDFLADSSISRTETVSVNAHKIPTGIIPLVCYSSSFSSRFQVNVDGPSYLAGGLSAYAPLNVTNGHTFVGRTAGLPATINASWALATGRQGALATWGTADASNLLSSTYRAGAALEIVISDPDNPPAPLLSTYTRDGQVIPALDLANYGGTGVLVVEMSDPSPSRGLAIIGSPTETGVPLTIVVVGNVTLVGSNSRAVTIATVGAITLVSQAPGGAIATSGSAQDTFWKGYICSPVENLSLVIDENWSSHSYSIMGGLAFKGGMLNASTGNGANTLNALNLSAPDAGSVANFRTLFAPPCRYDSLAVFQNR